MEDNRARDIMIEELDLSAEKKCNPEESVCQHEEYTQSFKRKRDWGTDRDVGPGGKHSRGKVIKLSKVKAKRRR